MTINSERQLKTGGDPRTLADYAALRDEMNKLTHPARPDVNWQHAETLCLSLFEHNGVELQTAAWYTLARTHLAGLYGMNEGLALLAALVVRQWGSLWPQPVHARVEILSAMSKRLQQVVRTLTLTYADLGQLYQAEENLNALSDMLQRLELKHAAQLDALRTMMQNAAVRLENSENTGVSLPGNTVGAAELHLTEPTERSKWVYVVQPEPLPNKEPPVPAKQWKPFAAGMLFMLVAASIVAVGWQTMHAPDSVQTQLAASLTPLPDGLSTAQLQALQQTSPPPEPGISKTQQLLAQLLHLKPDWAVSYGDRLVQQALTLWPEEAKPLAQQWHKQISVAVLAESELNGWHQGMTQLQQLTNRLNALDEQKGKYMTVSELKSAVFAMSQSFSHTVPLEEQLRLLSILPAGQPVSAAQLNQTEQHLQQLIASYALLKHQKE
ncbi:VasL domain-containing protein [Enterobacter hormaechei]|uniref:VasL domain-containing protein n=1 Tax=Enterobacter hormaechei TaxID=158836 RepID=UPI00298C849E|nr:VasL domain-containing protein [Enterobacter hormaechei]